MKQKDVKKLLDLKYTEFGKFYNNKKQHDSYILNNMKNDYSLSLTIEYDNDIIGGYFIKYTGDISGIPGNFFDLSGLEGMKE